MRPTPSIHGRLLIGVSITLLLVACAQTPLVSAPQAATSTVTSTVVVQPFAWQHETPVPAEAAPLDQAGVQHHAEIAVQPTTFATRTAAAATPTRLPTQTPQPTSTPTPQAPLAPSLDGGGLWFNAEPLHLADLRGSVVLIQFWTYGCYNCTNTLPAVREWWHTYQEQGLTIIGVHTPELAWEYDSANVEAAIMQEGISWPVVQDNDYTIWRAYGNRYWPRFYLIDHHGRIIYDHIGEGAYDVTEQQIVAALAAAQTARATH